MHDRAYARSHADSGNALHEPRGLIAALRGHFGGAERLGFCIEQQEIRESPANVNAENTR